MLLHPSLRPLSRQHHHALAHFALEAQILLPAITAGPGPMPLIGRLPDGRRRICQLAAEAKAPRNSAALSASAALLRGHVRVEENELFEQIQSRLSQEALARPGGEPGSGSAPACSATGSPSCLL